MTFTDEQQRKLAVAQEILGYRFADEQLLLSAITHPSATEGKSVKYSYERLEFLGDSILGAIVATIAFDRFHDLDEGGLTRIKVALVSGASLSDVAERLGFADVIVFGSSETGTGCIPRWRTCTRPWWPRCSWTAASRLRRVSCAPR